MWDEIFRELGAICYTPVKGKRFGKILQLLLLVSGKLMKMQLETLLRKALRSQQRFSNEHTWSVIPELHVGNYDSRRVPPFQLCWSWCPPRSRQHWARRFRRCAGHCGPRSAAQSHKEPWGCKVRTCKHPCCAGGRGHHSWGRILDLSSMLPKN